jgi:hypothetical protein
MIKKIKKKIRKTWDSYSHFSMARIWPNHRGNACICRLDMVIQEKLKK